MAQCPVAIYVVHLLKRGEKPLKIPMKDDGFVQYNGVPLDDKVVEYVGEYLDKLLHYCSTCPTTEFILYGSSSSATGTGKVVSSSSKTSEVPRVAASVIIEAALARYFKDPTRVPSLKNLTIVHETTNTDYIVVDRPGRVGKVLNVFPGTVEDNRKLLPDDQDILFNTTYQLAYNTTSYARKTTASIQIWRPTEKKDALTDQAWFTWFLGRSPCASGRLSQMSGTCWFNSGLNIMLLTPVIAEYMKAYWNTELTQSEKTSSQASFDVCLHPSADLRKMLNIVVYNLLIKHRKAVLSDGDFMQRLAAATKLRKQYGQDEKTQAKKLSELPGNSGYGSSGFARDAIEIIMATLFDHPSPKNSVYDVISFKNAPDAQRAFESSHAEKALYKLPQTLQTLSGSLSSSKDILLMIPADVYRLYPDGSKRLEVGSFSTLPETISVGSSRFSLQSAAASSPNHTIACFTCNRTRYVYDSNRYLVRVPGWPKGDLHEYRDRLRDLRASYSNQDFGKFDYAVYVLEARMLQVQQQLAEQAGGGSSLLRRMQKDMRKAREKVMTVN